MLRMQVFPSCGLYHCEALFYNAALHGRSRRRLRYNAALSYASRLALLTALTPGIRYRFNLP